MSGGRRSLRLLGEKILKMKSRKYHFNYLRSGEMGEMGGRRGCFIGVGYGTGMVTGK